MCTRPVLRAREILEIPGSDQLVKCSFPKGVIALALEPPPHTHTCQTGSEYAHSCYLSHLDPESPLMQTCQSAATAPITSILQSPS